MRLQPTGTAAAVVILLRGLSNCATPIHQSQAVSAQAVSRANGEIRALPAPVPYLLEDAEAAARVQAIAARLRPGALTGAAYANSGYSQSYTSRL